MKALGVTHSVCEACRAIVPAKVFEQGGDVFFEKFCPEHGTSRSKVRADVDDYLRTLRYVKPAWVPQEFSGNSTRPCPDGCGYCSRHEQHLCMPIVEITSRCDLACPVCLVDAGRPWDLSREELSKMLDRLIAAERQIDVLNLSGGEPLVHPDLLGLVDEALRRPEIVRVSISTNGLSLLADPGLADQLGQRNVVVSLQFDGFEAATYARMRGRGELAAIKRDLVETLVAEDLAASLTVTLARGVNERELPAILDLFLAHDNLLSMTIQPFSHEGGGLGFVHDPLDRVTIPEVIRLLADGSRGVVDSGDFTPLPCCHPTCFCLTFLLRVQGGGWLPIKRILPVDDYLDLIRNRSYASPDDSNVDRMRNLMYELWSGPVAQLPQSEGALKTIKAILRQIEAARGPSPKETVRIAERRMKSIYIHQFMDAETFDVSRVRRCCTVYPKEDGRFYPMCVYNVLHRGR